MKSKPLTFQEKVTTTALACLILAILTGCGYFYLTGHTQAIKPKNGQFGVKDVHI
jgi:hypothetical protein